MALLRSRQQFITDALENFNAAFNNLNRILANVILGTLFQKSKQNLIINLEQVFLSDLRHPENIEEPEQPRCDVVSASAGRPAGSQENAVD